MFYQIPKLFLKTLETWTGGSAGATALNVSSSVKPQFRKGKYLSLRHAKAVYEGRVRFILGADSFDVSAIRTYLSKTGRNITILFGESLINQKLIIAAYPEKQHQSKLREASALLALRDGPGDLFRGSLGVLEAVRHRTPTSMLSVQYLQSSFPVTQAVEEGIVGAEFKRCYAAWAVCLIDEILKYAAEEKCAQVKFPYNNILGAGIKVDKLRKLAADHNFVLCEKPAHYNLDRYKSYSFKRK